MTTEQLCKDIPDYLQDDKLPWLEWVNYRGEHLVACVNYERSISCNRPVIDLSYCMTKAMNNIVLKTVNWKEEHFKKSSLAV